MLKKPKLYETYYSDVLSNLEIDKKLRAIYQIYKKFIHINE